MLVVLSILVVTTVSISQLHGELQQARQRLMRARQLAGMGIAVASHPLIKPGDPLLRRKVSGLERFDVILGTDESRLNLNALLTEQHLQVFEHMFKSWGMSLGDSLGMVATLMDWTETDNLKRRPDSAEKFNCDNLGFSDLPFDRKFISMLYSPGIAHEPSTEVIGS